MKSSSFAAPVERVLDLATESFDAAADSLSGVRKALAVLRPSLDGTPAGGHTRFVPEPVVIGADETESEDTWGFADTGG